MRRTRFFSTIFFVCFALYSVINVLSAVSLTADRYPSSPPHSHADPIRDTRQPSTLPLYAQRPGIPPGHISLPPAVLPVFSLFHSAVYYQFHSPFVLSLAQSGDEGIRTPGLRRAKAALSHLSYIPKLFIFGVVGLTGFEPVTPALSAQCSNHLSYRPLLAWPQQLRSDRKHYVTEMLATPCETLV
jgi:hypothetical protein